MKSQSRPRHTKLAASSAGSTASSNSVSRTPLTYETACRLASPLSGISSTVKWSRFTDAVSADRSRAVQGMVFRMTREGGRERRVPLLCRRSHERPERPSPRKPALP
jgi:hypothetical protein